MAETEQQDARHTKISCVDGVAVAGCRKMGREYAVTHVYDAVKESDSVGWGLRAREATGDSVREP